MRRDGAVWSVGSVRSVWPVRWVRSVWPVRSVRSVRSVWLVWSVVVAAVVIVPAAGPPRPAAAATGGTVEFGTGGFEPLVPVRLLDTRDGTGVPSAGVVGPGGVIDLQVAGRGGVPALGAGAVVLNVVSTESTADSFVTAWPTGVGRPLAANLNITARRTVGNLVVVKLGTGGRISLFNLSGATHLVADVQGWFPEGGALSPMTPTRLLDTRDGTGVDAAGPVAAGGTVRVQVAGRHGIPATGVGAVVMNVAVTETTADGYLTAYPSGVERPLAANLNWVARQTVPNLVTAKVGEDGAVELFNFAGSTQIIADVAGWFPVGSGFEALAPSRLLDTRDGTGVDSPAPVPAGGVVSLQVAGRNGVPATGVGAVVVNVTVTQPTSDSYITVWPSGVDRPVAANLNMRPGQTVPNLVIAKVGVDGRINLFNYAGSTHLVADVAGWFPATPAGAGVMLDLKPGTVLAGAGDVLASTGASDVGGTVTLAGSADVPAVGGHLVIPPHPSLPQGFSGLVTNVVPNPDGTTTVTLATATLDQMFDDVEFSYDGPVGEIDAGASTPARFQTDPSSAEGARLDGAPPNQAGCEVGTGAQITPVINVSVSDATFDFDLTDRYLKFVMPVVTTVGFAGTVSASWTCTVTFGQATFFLPYTFLVITPQITITASAALTTTATVTTTSTVGVLAQGSDVTNLSSFARSASGDLSGEVQASLEVRPSLRGSLKFLGLAGGYIDAGIDIIGTLAPVAVPCVLITVQPTITFGIAAGTWILEWEVELAEVKGPRWTILEVRDSCPNADVRWIGSIEVSSNGPNASHAYYSAPPAVTWVGTLAINRAFSYRIASTKDTLINTYATSSDAEGMTAVLQALTYRSTWTAPGSSGVCDTQTGNIRPEVGWSLVTSLHTDINAGPVAEPPPGQAYLLVTPYLGMDLTCSDGQSIWSPATVGLFDIGQEFDADHDCLAPAIHRSSGHCYLPVQVSADGSSISFHGTLSGSYDELDGPTGPVTQTVHIELTKVVD